MVSSVVGIVSSLHWQLYWQYYRQISPVVVGGVDSRRCRHCRQSAPSAVLAVALSAFAGNVGNRHFRQSLVQCEQYRQLVLSALSAVNTISSIGNVSIRQCNAATADDIRNAGICRQGSASALSATSAIYISGLWFFVRSRTYQIYFVTKLGWGRGKNIYDLEIVHSFY